MVFNEDMDGGVISPSTDAVNLSDPDNQDGVNELFGEIIAADPFAPIAVTYERIRQTLRGVGYTLPSALEQSALLSDTEGDIVFTLSFSELDPMYLYFAFVENDDQSMEVFAEILTAEDLTDILSE